MKMTKGAKKLWRARKRREFWKSLFQRYCKNCYHPVKTSREMGNHARPNKVWHYIDGYGSYYCPECECKTPE